MQAIALKREYSYGNTQIPIAPHSSAALSLNMARDTIREEDVAGTGKDVDPNHVTLRYGLLTDDVEELRDFLARQRPFDAEVTGIELFPVSEHGTVPVVARIASQELHALEAEIEKYADFKEKSFPVYKPHCTLAYCKPEAAPYYASLPVSGTFLVQEVTISHASGVKETIPFGGVQKKSWSEAQHPRQPKGSDRGGEFMEVLYSPKDALDSLLNGEKDVNIDRNDVRQFLELAGQQHEDPDITDLHVEGMEIFGGNGLGIDRQHMPQIPRANRREFLHQVQQEGVKITREYADPLTLKPSQNAISARRVAEKLVKYEKGNKVFPPPLVSESGRILDGHHHWAMMAAYALDDPQAKMPIFRMRLSTAKALAVMHSYMHAHGLERKSLSGEVQKADPASGRYVTPFVSFEKQGDEQLRMIASLNSSRLATWGFTAEAEVLGMTRYRLTAVLDGRTSEFCRMIDGKVFDVSDARAKVIDALNVQDPEDLKTVQPWPRQTKTMMAEYRKMSNDQLVGAGLHIPPYHPHCRTLLRHVPSSIGQGDVEPVETVPDDVETFQPVTADDLQALGLDATPEQVDQWNQYIGMNPTELISRLTGIDPTDVLSDEAGSNPLVIDEDGIGVKTRGASNGVEFKANALLDPFTGIFYLTQADLLAGTPKAEMQFLKTLFSGLLDTGQQSAATSLAVEVGGNAAYYAKLGFQPDDLAWDNMRMAALEEIDTGSLQPMMEMLAPEDQELVKHLLQDGSPSAISALVELPFTYEGRTIGEWILEETAGIWELDLTDQDVIDHAMAYLA